MKTEEITDTEAGAIALMRYNQMTRKTEITKQLSIGRLKIVFNWRSSKNLMGRFGGGWNWKVGIMIGGHSVILNLLVFSLRFSWNKP